MADIIRAASLWGYCQLTSWLGREAEPMLAEVGLSTTDLDDPDAYLDRGAVVALLDLSAGRFECPDFGMRLAGVQDINILGALSFAIRNASDLRDAWQTAARHVSYHAPDTDFCMEPCGDGCHRFVFGLGERAHASQAMELTAGLFSRITMHLTGGAVRPKRFTLAHPRIATPDVYKEHLGAEPDFDEEMSAAVLTQAELNFPLKSANSQLKSIVERYLDAHAPHEEHPIERRVHQALARLIRSEGRVSIEDVADMMRMHPRTLQRRLKECGASFERIRDTVRREQAEAYLADPRIPIAHVALLLGYANQAVLTRSTSRWFGKTPLAFRRGAAAGLAH